MRRDYCGQTLNGLIKLPTGQKLLQNFDGTTSLSVNAGSENFPIEVSIFNQQTQNTVPSVRCRNCSPQI